MLLAYFAYGGAQGTNSSLCLVSEKLENKDDPVNIDALNQSDAGVFYVGYQEAVVVEISETERAKIIRPVPPAAIFLTPNSPSQPGYKVIKIKVIYHEDSQHELFFSREQIDNWKPWVPYTKSF